ncbi:MAG: peptidyl-prolyl cis-trans isomerase [Actinobacteria bacterium]|nr:peptidyl-prolyl cis-trans isomerase [Actinomycetota bacterium]
MTLRRIALVLACGLLLSGCGDTFRTAAAVVNGERITDDQVQQQLELALADPQTSAQLGTGQEREDNIKDATRLTLSFLIQEELIQAYARQHDLQVDSDDLDAALADVVQQAGGQRAFEQTLDDRGLSIADVRLNVERQLLAQAVAEEITSKEVSEAELRASYQDRINEFTEVHISHILVTSPDAAEALATRATPANFARLARQESEDPASADAGGDLGVRKAVELPQQLGQAVLRVPLNRVSGPVQIDQGFEIFIVHSRREIPFAEVRADLLAERQSEVFSTWLADQVRQADIRVNPRYGRLDVASGRIVEPATTDENATPEPQLTP